MKKKSIIAILIACMIMLTAGCGEKSSDLSETSLKVNGTVQADGTDSSEKEETVSGALNVENDTFTIGQLSEKIGASESEILELLGKDKKAESYETELFGEKAEIILSIENDRIVSITLKFAETKADLIINAVSEQMGQDEEKTGNSFKWVCENNVITLTQADAGCVIEIHE